MQSSRRSTPYPWTWELPVAALTAVLLLLVLAVHAGRTLANGTTLGEWAFTPREDLFTSLPALLAGDARVGLPPGPAASRGALYAWIVLCESATCAGLLWCALSLLCRWGPGRVRGMASRAETEQLLGLRHLRATAPLVRPDLHSRRGRR
ncbi:hypothetical protein [Phycicoccus sp. DTK01]|uniref:hypothetical protein n=1 Tax=Phycicoccus sp. DTK01 TaxID=2785745 RepID=UPI001A8DAA50|nr:hypothetical protein [Phycicoccus sp. DTK01]GIL37583.1 hypothetical protein PDTK01_36580 [Phycicoccus sp. DTK01]